MCMKENYKKIIFSVLSIALVLGSVSSCVEDGIDAIEGKGPSIIRMQVNTKKYDVNFTVAAFDPVIQTKTVLVINRDAVSNGDLNTTVTVDFALDSVSMRVLNDSIATAALKANEDLVAGVDQLDTLFVLPTSVYTWSAEGLSGNTLTFAPGEFVKELSINLDPATLSFSKSYALPIRLSNASSNYQLSAEVSFAVVQVIVKNDYDATYASTGTRYNYNAASDYGGWPPTGYTSANTWTFDWHVLTAGPNTCSVHAANSDGGFGTMNITVNNDNTVLIESTSDTGLTNLVPLPGMTSTYDPSTKTFQLYYQYTNANGTFRVVEHKLVAK